MDIRGDEQKSTPQADPQDNLHGHPQGTFDAYPGGVRRGDDGNVGRAPPPNIDQPQPGPVDRHPPRLFDASTTSRNVHGRDSPNAAGYPAGRPAPFASNLDKYAGVGGYPSNSAVGHEFHAGAGFGSPGGGFVDGPAFAPPSRPPPPLPQPREYTVDGDGRRATASTTEGNMVNINHAAPSASSTAPSAPSTTPPAPDDRSTLEKCIALDGSISNLESRLDALSALHRRVLNDRVHPSQIDPVSADITTSSLQLVEQLGFIKSGPDASQPTNAPQVGRLGWRLEAAIKRYSELESEFRTNMREQQARQFRIVRPDATDEQIEHAIENGGGQIFQQALLNSNRMGEVDSTLDAVRSRHDEIERIERTMEELSQLLEYLDQIVAKQEPVMEATQQVGEQVEKNIADANDQLDKGIVRRLSARRKKWICFWISVLVIVILILVIGIYLGFIKPRQSK